MCTRQGFRWLMLAGCLALAGCADSVDTRDVSQPSPTETSSRIAEKPVPAPDAVETVKTQTAADKPNAETIAPVAPADMPADGGAAGTPKSDTPAGVSPEIKPAGATASAAEPPKAVTTAPAPNPYDLPSAATNPALPGAKPSPPRKVELLVKNKVFATDAAQGVLRVSYDDLDLLKVLNMEPVTKDVVEKMPGWQKGLDGKRIIIRGFMRQTFSETGLTEFLLVRDAGLCCFGPNPKIYDMIHIAMAEGTTTDYIELRPFDVVGTFHINLKAEDDLIFGLYYIDDARIIRK